MNKIVDKKRPLLNPLSWENLSNFSAFTVSDPWAPEK